MIPLSLLMLRYAHISLLSGSVIAQSSVLIGSTKVVFHSTWCVYQAILDVVTYCE
jgi:hypothetical protein